MDASKLRLFVVILSSVLLSQFSQGQTKFHLGDEKLYYGVAYYPEAWDLDLIDQDIERMKDVNMNVVRMAEFAWSTMEPNEGEYHFQWLHNIIEKLHANGIDVVLGTPTATPPAWMWEKYPEIARVDSEGLHTIHGARRSTRFTSHTYREKSRQIVERMAQEFGRKPGVIGWQIDNEFHVSPDYSPETRVKWHEWLRERYVSIDNLNQIWATKLWSQEYQNFQQIPMPLDRIWHHNSLRFEWHNFSSQMVFDFQKLQIDAIKKHSDLPITHDTMPGQSLDYYQLLSDADFVSVNNYHSFEAYDRILSNYDRMRGMNKGMHWLFETAPNYSGGGKEGKTWFLHQPDGSMKAAMWFNYALGGQGTMFWLWRQHPAGQEMVHGSVISAWNKPAANYQELKALGAELREHSDFMMQNPVAPAEIGIFYSHQSDAGLRIENYVNDIRYYTDWTYRFYLAFHDVYLHRDVIYPAADLERYKVLFAPMLPLIPSDTRNRLERWVKDGGTLILGPLSGYRTEYWTAFTDHAIGNISDWSEIEVDSRIPVGVQLRPAEIPLNLEWKIDLESDHDAYLWSEALSSDKGTTLAIYKNGMHQGKKAIIENKVGKGKVVYLGTDPGREAVAKLLLRYAAEKNIEPLAVGDPGVLVVPRKGKSNATILVNYTNEIKSISLPRKGTDLLTGEKSGQNISLSPFQVLLIEH